jgi:N-acyl-L-homoserine lactone synthetase
MHGPEIGRPDTELDDTLTGLLAGYRFSVCTDVPSVARAVEIRRRVYVGGNGYDVPVPDAYDERSWHLLAEDVSAGIPCGSMRITPRAGGPVEAEEYFRLPPQLRQPRTIELSRFAILPEYRKGKTFLPIVSVGLFALVRQVLERAGVRRMVICTKPERVWTFEWMRFQRTGLRARYEKLGGSEHELLSWDLHRASRYISTHPFRVFWDGRTLPQLEVPDEMPRLGLFGAYETREVAVALQAQVA